MLEGGGDLLQSGAGNAYRFTYPGHLGLKPRASTGQCNQRDNSTWPTYLVSQHFLDAHPPGEDYISNAAQRVAKLGLLGMRYTAELWPRLVPFDTVA